MLEDSSESFVSFEHSRSVGDWWRVLIVLAYMTGWRVGQMVSLKLSDIDLDKGTPLTRADVADNKGNRDERIPLHPKLPVKSVKRNVQS